MLYPDSLETMVLWTDGIGDTANIDRSLTPGPFFRCLLFSDRLLQTCLLVKAFYTSLPFILKIYPSERQIPPDSYAFLVIQKAALVRDLV